MQLNNIKQEDCKVCLNSVPNKVSKKCIAFPTNNPREWDNCREGYRYHHEVIQCQRCKPGFVLYEKRQKSVGRRSCVKESGNWIGCRLVNQYLDTDLICYSCDDLRGYHFDGKGRNCVKVK